MPIQPMNFAGIEPRQHPFAAALQNAFNTYGQGVNARYAVPFKEADLLAKLLENQKSQDLLPFIKPQAEADLRSSILKNKWYEPNMKSQMDYRNSKNQNELLQNKWFEPKLKAEMGLQNAQAREIGANADMTRYKLGHPGLLGGADTKEIQTLIDMGIISKDFNNGQQNIPQQPSQNNPLQQPSSNSQINPDAPFNTNNPLVNAFLNRKFIQAAYQKKMTEGFTWNHLPVETKNQLVAQGYGMGIEPTKMMNYINNGMGIEQIAKAEGLDPKNLPGPKYPPTSSTKTRTQQVEQVGQELDYLSSASTPLIEPYADTVLGISPKLKIDVLSSDPEVQKRVGRYVAAQSIQTGLATGRYLLEGGRSTGIEVLKMVKDSANIGIDPNHAPFKMSKVAYKEAQNTINDILQRGAKIRTITGMNPFSEIGKAHPVSGSLSNKNPSEMTTEEIKAELAAMGNKK